MRSSFQSSLPPANYNHNNKPFETTIFLVLIRSFVPNAVTIECVTHEHNVRVCLCRANEKKNSTYVQVIFFSHHNLSSKEK